MESKFNMENHIRKDLNGYLIWVVEDANEQIKIYGMYGL